MISGERWNWYTATVRPRKTSRDASRCLGGTGVLAVFCSTKVARSCSTGEGTISKSGARDSSREAFSGATSKTREAIS